MATALEMAQPGFDPYADVAEVAGDTAIFGFVKKAAKSVSSAVSSVAKNPIVKTAVGAARTALKNAGPIGAVANGAISAMDAGLSGKNIGEVATAAALGAAPSGIDTALKAGMAIAKGDNVLNTAIKSGADAFAPGSGERFAYSVAVDVLKKGPTKATLGAARRSLASEGQRRAFDAAVGVIAKTQGERKGSPFAAIANQVKNRVNTNVKKVVQTRVANNPRIKALLKRRAALLKKRKVPKKPKTPKGKSIVKKAPILRALSSGRPTARAMTTISPRGNVPVAARPTLVQKSHAIPKNRIVKWRRMSPRAAAFILSRVPMASKLALLGRDTGALSGGLTASQMPTVRFGSNGSPVKTLQATLNEKTGANLVVDGKFGNLTLGAVKAFQAANGLVVDGIVGPKTWGALDAAAPLPVVLPTLPKPTSTTTLSRPTIRFGSRGTAVSDAQTLLNLKHGSGLKVDGIFGNNTLTATKSFQKAKGLVVDGIIGPKTWAALDSSPIKSLPSTSPAPVIPSLPSVPVISTPSIGEQAADTSAIVQAKAILVAWSKTDGLVEAGLTDYGTRAEDLSTTFGPRDKFMCAAFARWNNKTQGTKLNTDGDLTPAVSDALRLWAEKRAATTASPPITASPLPSVPSVPSVPALPAPTLPTVSTAPDGTTVVNLPTDIVTAKPPTVTVAKKPEEKGDSQLVLAGGGAALGYLLGGPIGALLGGGIGAVAGGTSKG